MITIQRIFIKFWNFEKWNVNEYKNVIFNKNEFYDSYQHIELLTDMKKNQLNEFDEYEFLSIISSLNEVQKIWLQLPFKKKENMNETKI